MCEGLAFRSVVLTSVASEALNSDGDAPHSKENPAHETVRVEASQLALAQGG